MESVFINTRHGGNYYVAAAVSLEDGMTVVRSLCPDASEGRGRSRQAAEYHFRLAYQTWERNQKETNAAI